MPMDQPTLIRALLRDRAKLHAFIWAMVQNDDLAEDVLQEVMVLVLEKRDKIRDEAHLPAWSRRAARLTAMAALRKKRGNPIPLDNRVLDLLEEEWDKLDRVESSSVADALRTCLAKLTPRSATLIRMRYAEGLKSGQIAAQLKQDVNTIYVALGRIHQALAACVKRELARGGPHHA